MVNNSLYLISQALKVSPNSEHFSVMYMKKANEEKKYILLNEHLRTTVQNAKEHSLIAQIFYIF